MKNPLFKRWLALCIAGGTLLIAIIACGAATANNVRIRDLPQFICATTIPLPTHTEAATQIQPPLYTPPSGFSTSTPYPGCRWNGSLCATNTPVFGGIYTTPGIYLPGATSTPRPTHTPWPTATPYILTGRFFFGADVYTGGFESEISLRLRIESAQVYAVDASRQVVAWQIEIENIGQVSYTTIPGGQVFIAEVNSGGVPKTGQWWASAEAAQAAGITLQAQVLDALQVNPGESYRLTLTAFTPIGDLIRFGWVLDPLADSRDGDLVGGNIAYWASDVSAECTTNPDSGMVIPTLEAQIPTPTATRTPQYPPWCTWCSW